MKNQDAIMLKKPSATKILSDLSDKTMKKKAEATGFFYKFGNVTLFISRTIRETFSRGFEGKEFLRQCYEIGNKSLPLIGITGAIMGVVLTIQSRPTLATFGAENMLPKMVAISLIREIGPVITALICAGKVGSGMGAELGSMRVTEQIDAMEVSATNPMKYLVVTRVLAATLMLPLLVIFADAFGLFGSWLGVNIKGDINFFLFLGINFPLLNFSTFKVAVLKC